MNFTRLYSLARHWRTWVVSWALTTPIVVCAQNNRVTPTGFDRDQQNTIIRDLSDVFMQDFQQRPRRGESDLPTPTQEMRALRQLLRNFSDEISQLGFLLNDEVRRQPALRSLYTMALNLSGTAVSLDKQAQQTNDHNLLEQDLRTLDAQWRELSYRLQNAIGIRREIVASVNTLNTLADQIRNTVNIRPQINRRELALKTQELARNFANLIEDVQIELPGTESRSFITQLTRVRQSLLNLATLFEDQYVDLELITNEYKQYQALWYPLRARLQEYDNRYFERSLRRITQTEAELHQLLLLPNKVDTQQLVYLTSVLRKDIDEFFDRMSLRLLMSIPQADRVPGVASEFYGVCEHFIDSVQTNAKYSDLVESFRYIEAAQRSFLGVFQNVPSREAQAALRQIAKTIDALRTTMGVQSDTVDYSAAIDLTAQVESLAEQLEWVARRWLSRDRQPFSSACLAAISRLRSNLLALHQDLVAGNGSATQYRQQIEQIYNNWREVYNHIVKCQTEDRPNLGKLASRITPTLVELRTLLTP
ncbi:MAG: hypothetical protein KatS3mg114_0065 [Planctomycetaceae bacterium]|nr:MAG: hypothetical protein KatS3mg114_0065 [Planctomycetaceae bacterium]